MENTMRYLSDFNKDRNEWNPLAMSWEHFSSLGPVDAELEKRWYEVQRAKAYVAKKASEKKSWFRRVFSF